jgi:hypothetical protein
MQSFFFRLRCRAGITGLILGSLTLAVLKTQAAPPTPLLHYTFDEAGGGPTPALDSGVAPQTNGLFSGSATRTSNTPNGSGYALNVSTAGASDYLHSGNPAKLNGLSNLTLTCWVNLRANQNASDRLISKFSTTAGFDFRFNNATASSAQLIFELNTNSGSSASSAANINALNQWVFLAVTYDGSGASSSQVNFYSGLTNVAVTQLGTAQTVTVVRGPGIEDTTNEFRVASTAATTADRTPPAWIDDVRVYNTVLSQSDLESVRLEILPVAPSIIQQPSGLNLPQGSNATFTVTVGGPSPYYHQWYFVTNLIATNALSKATNATLTLTNIGAAQVGGYFVVVTNQYGSTTSSVANLTISTPGVPALTGAIASPTRNGIALTFNQPIADSATNPANFSLTAGISVLNASLDSTYTNLSLTTSLQPPNVIYTLGISNIQNRSSSQIMSLTTTNLFSPPLYGPANNVQASAVWTLLYSIPLANAVNYNTNGTPYSMDHHLWATNYSRVAYYLETQSSNGPMQFVWVDMDAFSANPVNLGVPSIDTGASFQQAVSNLDVYSSVAGVATGSDLSNGSIKFFPGNDGSPNTAGRGAMQVKLNGNVLFAFNGWGSGITPDLGIGNNVGNTNADWSYMTNATGYTVKRLLVYVLPKPQTAPVCADVVVYGGTSGGVIAAVRAGRMGKKTVLLCKDNHFGGMSSGGLGWTDIGNNGTSYIGGLALEFYQRNGAYYGQSIKYDLEPHVAEKIYGQMLAQAGVQVFFNQTLASVTMNNKRIAQITMDDGSVYAGKMFIDTTYEGDLITGAGVSYTIGREGTNVYGESLAGVQTPSNGGVSYDPYVVPGNPSSGLLPLMNSVTLNPQASSDNGVQAYNYRMCFTQSGANFLPITAPADYDATQYILLARYIAALGSVTLGQFITLDRPDTTGKYDINNNGQISTDLVGASWTWPTNNTAGRALLRQYHEDYTRGFFIFLATSPLIPANIRSAMQSWGMCQDEFLDTGGWPHDIYVREARRMVSDYVMTQQNCQGSQVAGDSIGLASYTIDSHTIWRLAVKGTSQIEGGLGTSVTSPFPISYRSLIPRVGECENVLCTFALSASHVAFSSCRMEPVFMITSDSAATAASIAIDDNLSVQNVNYNKLALQLSANGQNLGTSIMFSSSNSIIVDDADATGVNIQGTWTSSTAVAGYWGTDYLTDGNSNKGGSSVSFTPTLPSNGVYQVYLRWTADANRATNVPVDIIYPAGTNTVMVNQQVNGGQWVLLLTTNFNAGTSTSVVIRNTGTTGYVIADAVQFLLAGAPTTSVEVISSLATTSIAQGPPGSITFARGGNTNSVMTVYYTLGGTASNGIDYLTLPGAVTFAAGATFTNVTIVPLVAETNGLKTIIITLQGGTNYSVGNLDQATEILLGANSPQPASLQSPLPQAGGWQLNFQGTPGGFYEVQRATSLTGPWLDLGLVSVDLDGSAQWLDATPPNTQAFYRISLIQNN